MEQIKRNIEDIRERLKTESNPRVRWALQRALFQEAYKIGFSRELIDFIDREIAGWRDWIDRQQSLVERLANSGLESELAETLLLLAQQTLAVHELHRRRILRILALNALSEGRSSPPDDGRRTSMKPESKDVRGAPSSDQDEEHEA